MAGLRAVPATGWSYFLGLGVQGFVCTGHLTSIFVTKCLNQSNSFVLMDMPITISIQWKHACHSEELLIT